MSPRSRRRLLRILAPGILVGFAGCSSEAPADETPATPTTTATSTPTATPIPEERITEFEQLTEDGRELFEQLLSQEHVEIGSDRLPSGLEDAEYVRHQDAVYAVTKTYTDEFVSEYTLEVQTIHPDYVDQEEVVAYGDLTEEAQDAFLEAVETGSVSYRDETLPGKLVSTSYVKYDDDYYELTVIIADIPIVRISEEQVRG